MEFRPSERHRWSRCSAYPAFRALLSESGSLPPDTSSIYAMEGTAAHKLLETVLQPVASYERGGLLEWGEDPSQTLYDIAAHSGTEIDVDGTPIPVTEEMQQAVWECVCTVAKAVRACGRDCRLAVETRVQAHDEVAGTADVLVWGRGSGAVIDFKYGRGVAVRAADNPQLQCYAVGAIRRLGGEWGGKLSLTISQPRNGGEKISRHDISEAAVWSNWIADEVSMCKRPTRRLAVGDWCKWCPCTVACPAVRQHTEDVLHRIAMPERVASTDDRELGDMLVSLTDVVEPYLAAVRQEMHRRLSAGKTSSEECGWKLVAGKNRREWADEEYVVKLLSEMGFGIDEIYAQKMKSPAQVEKLLKKSHMALDLSGAVHVVPGKEALVRYEDSRAELPQLVALGELAVL